MTLKSDAKFKEKLACSFKYDTRNLVNFDPNIQKSENFFLMGSLVGGWSYNNTEELPFMTLHSDAKFE